MELLLYMFVEIAGLAELDANKELGSWILCESL